MPGNRARPAGVPGSAATPGLSEPPPSLSRQRRLVLSPQAPTAASWPSLRPGVAHRPAARGDAAVLLGLRCAAIQVGYRLGWASLVVVLGGIALGVGVQHRWLVVAATLAAVAGNTVAMVVPWREWLADRRGKLLLDLWCAALIGFVALLVVNGGSNFSILLFLTVPFIAVVQSGRRRGLWLAAVAATCTLVAMSAPASAGATAMRLTLVATAVVVALALVRALQREAARAELERTRAKEASHRIKNDLQTAADLLLLGRPADAHEAAFDETAARIRSIANVHRLLTEADDLVDAGALLRSIAAGAPLPVAVEAEPSALDAMTAQRLGLVANELLTNAVRHGAPPIVLRLGGGTLSVEDRGEGVEGAPGLGLDLVRRLVEHGLGGRFELQARRGGGTRAEVVFPTVPQ